MDIDPDSIYNWLTSDDSELQASALEGLCTSILYTNDGSFANRIGSKRFIKAILGLFYNESADEFLLEVATRTLFHLLELLNPQPADLDIIKIKHYKIISARLDSVDMFSPTGIEFAQRLIKLLNFISDISPRKVYLGGALISVLRFFRLHSEFLYADVVQSSMNVVTNLCSHCDPHDKNMPELMSSLTELLSHKNYDLVVKKVLQALGSIFDRYSQAGCDISSIASRDVCRTLCRHLFTACQPLLDKSCLNSVFFYHPSLLDVAESSLKNMNAGVSEDRPDLALTSTLSDVLLTLCCCSSDAAQYLLEDENHVIFSLACLLLNCTDSSVVGGVFRLLLVIILKLGQESSTSEDDNSARALQDFWMFRAAIDAIKRSDCDLIESLLSGGLNLLCVDNHGQSLLDWAVAYSDEAVVQRLISQLEFGLKLNLNSSLGYAAAFGNESACQILLERGANPSYVSPQDGLNPLDRLKHFRPVGYNSLEKLLGKAAKANGGASNEPDVMTSTVCEFDEHFSTEMRLFILATEIAPVLLTTYSKTQSESIKYQVLLILLKLVGRLSPISLETINKYPVGKELSHRLSHVLFVAMAEESEKLIHCAFRILDHLLTKARSIYLPLMSANGILPMVNTIHSMLQSVHFRSTNYTDCGNCYPTRNQSEDTGKACHNNSSDGDEDDNNGWEENDSHDESVHSEYTIYSTARSNTDADGADEYYDTQSYVEQEDEPDEISNSEDDEPYPMLKAQMEQWQGWSLIIFGDFLFVFCEYSVVMFDLKCTDDCLHGIYLIDPQKSPVVEFGANWLYSNPASQSCLFHFSNMFTMLIRGFDVLFLDVGLGKQVLFITRQLREMFNQSGGGGLFQNWPFFSYYNHPALVRPRGRTPSRERNSPSESGFGHRRSSSMPARRTFHPIGEEFKEDTEFKPFDWAHCEPVIKVIRAGDLLIDLVAADSDVPFLRVRPKGETRSCAFLFSSCPEQGFFRLRKRPFDATVLAKRPSRCCQQSHFNVFMDKHLWAVLFKSGTLRKRLFYQDENNHGDPSERQGGREVIRMDMRRLASKMLGIETISPEIKEPLRSAPPIHDGAKSSNCAVNSNGFASKAILKEFNEVISLLLNASSAPSKEAALKQLRNCFTRLTTIFTEPAMSPTAYQLYSSHLVPALLLCLSSTCCNSWFDVVNSNTYHDHLTFLLERRRAFLEVFRDSDSLTHLMRKLVTMLDLTERLPMHLFEQIIYPRSSGQVNASASSEPEITCATSPVPPRTCPPKTTDCFDFNTESVVEEYSSVIPLGLVAKPLDSSSWDYHERLIGGGVRGLVDQRVLLLLGAWFDELFCSFCTGTLGTPQVEYSFSLPVRPHADGVEEIREVNRPLYLAHRPFRRLYFHMLGSAEQMLHDQIFVKEWYIAAGSSCVSFYCSEITHQLERRDLPFLLPFWEKPQVQITLVPKTPVFGKQLGGGVTVSRGLFDWMGTCGGTVEKWMDPLECNLAAAAVSPPGSSVLLSNYLGQKTLCPPSSAMQRWQPVFKKDSEEEEEEEEDAIDTAIESGKRVGARFTVETGVELVPTAFCISSLRIAKGNAPIRKWCLQASGDGQSWMTLFTHKSDDIIESYTFIPLKQTDFQLWSRCTFRKSESGGTHSLASVSTAETQLKELSFRAFRIMDMTHVKQRCGVIVEGFDLFGTIRSVHRSLRSIDKFTGYPLPSSRPKKPTSEQGAASMSHQASRKNSESDSLHENCTAPISVHAVETTHPAVDERVLAYAEVLDLVVESNNHSESPEALISPTQGTPQVPRSPLKSQPPQREVEQAKPIELEKSSNASPSATTAGDGEQATSEEQAGADNLVTSEAHMQQQMLAVRDGREMRKLAPCTEKTKFRWLPNIIADFNPNLNQEIPSSKYQIRLSPSSKDSVDRFYLKTDDTQLYFELVARRHDGSVVASVPIDDLEAPMFKHVLELAERTLYFNSVEDAAFEGLPVVEVTIEYSFIKPVRSHNALEVIAQQSHLTSRDSRLINAQERQLERHGIRPLNQAAFSTARRTEDLLTLLEVLIKLTGSKDGGPAFHSSALTGKLDRQLRDVLAVSAGPALPDWCANLTRRITALFPYKTRRSLFYACAFGPSRSLIWLQNNVTPPETVAAVNSSTTSRLSTYLRHSDATRFTANIASHLGRENPTQYPEFDEESSNQLAVDVDVFTRRVRCTDCPHRKIGRLFKNYIVLPRDDDSADPRGGGFWAWAERALDEHADSKAELEIRFTGEEGTGTGPTLEFYTLLAMEFRRKSTGMWLAGSSSDSTSDYINPSFGLFPTPYPRDKLPLDVLRRFYIMGIAIGKSLLDNRLMELPFSKPFLKLLACCGASSGSTGAVATDNLESLLSAFANTEGKREQLLLAEDPFFLGLEKGVSTGSSHWLTGLLDFEDFAIIEPARAVLFRNLLQLHGSFVHIRRAHISSDDSDLQSKLDAAAVEVMGCTIEALGLDLEFVPDSTSNNVPVKLMDIYPWETASVVTEDLSLAAEPVSNDNFEVFVRRTLEYCLDKGIRAQMDAFKAGIERVFPMHWLSVFTSSEVGPLISGESEVAWTREELLAFTEPCRGYTVDSRAFLLLVDVLEAFSGEERRAFLRFVSGSTALPVGGLRNLSPRLCVVRKPRSEGRFPSVNTCAHYLKLPEYADAAELRAHLLPAMHQTGFDLN